MSTQTLGKNRILHASGLATGLLATNFAAANIPDPNSATAPLFSSFSQERQIPKEEPVQTGTLRLTQQMGFCTADYYLGRVNFNFNLKVEIPAAIMAQYPLDKDGLDKHMDLATVYKKSMVDVKGLPSILHNYNSGDFRPDTPKTPEIVNHMTGHFSRWAQKQPLSFAHNGIRYSYEFEQPGGGKTSITFDMSEKQDATCLRLAHE